MTFKSTTPDRTTAYARAVVSGRIVAGELAIAACKRHLDDLEHGRPRGLEWRAGAAEAMIDAYPAHFTITDGPSAGQPFVLLDWMMFVTGSLFGWFIAGSGRETGRWRFDEAYIETAKGQGKSPWMAATALLAMGVFKRQRAQIIVTGPKDDQAMVTMADAGAFVQSQMPGEDDGVSLESKGKFKVAGLGDNIHKIEYLPTRSVFKTKSGMANRVSGPRPDLVMVDEVHELVSTALIDMWQAALAKNASGGMLIACTNTPAMTQFTGTHYSERAQRVVTGRDSNDSLFAFITRVDIADRKTVFDDPACWPKAMPALGITFPAANIEREVAKARTNPSEKARVDRLYFGIPTGAVDFWLDDPTLWDRAQAAVDEQAMRGLRCWLALDLSEKHDLTALTAIWETAAATQDAPARTASKTFYWTCSNNIEKRARADQMPYDIWRDKAQINVVEGASITKDFVAVFVDGFCRDHEVDFLAFDVAGMANFVEACDRVGLATWRYKGPDERAGTGLKLVAHSQGTKRAFKGDQLDMHGSIEAIEDALRLGTTVIDDSPVTTACAANAAVEISATGNRAFDKKRSRGRIDGLVTLAMAHGAAAMMAKAKGPSVYQSRGALIL